MHTIEKFKPARLYNAKGDTSKQWYVEYYCVDPVTGQLVRIKERFDINRIKDKQLRLAYGRNLQLMSFLTF